MNDRALFVLVVNFHGHSKYCLCTCSLGSTTTR